MTRVLVTGASGFVGRPLTETLARAGYRVRAAARTPQAFTGLANVETAAMPEMEREADWSTLLAGIDAIVHLAGIAHIGPGVSDAAYDRVNHMATTTLAAAAKAAGVSRFVFMSSLRAQTGPAAHDVLNENTAPNPTDAYGRSKLAAERAVRAAGVAHTILRPALVYGPQVKGNLASLMRLAALPLPLPFGALTNRRSMVALDNLIGAVRFALESPNAVNETFVVADPQPLSLAEIVSMLRAAMGRRPALIAIPPSLLEAPLRAIGRRDLFERLGGTLVADPSKLMQAGWRPVVDAAAEIGAMVQAASPRKSGTASRRMP